jgi:hypothetical protein
LPASNYSRAALHTAADATYFIFELLQNAEDAGATRVKCSLFRDRLEVLKDGRFFSDADVRGICAIGKGTKSYDLTQIGKFGIGFKSVHAHAAQVNCTGSSCGAGTGLLRLQE